MRIEYHSYSFTLLTVLLLLTLPSESEGDVEHRYGYDILHYDVSLEVMEDVHRVSGSVGILFKACTTGIETIELDIVSMEVDSAWIHYAPLDFVQNDSSVTVFLRDHIDAGDTSSVWLSFSGIPGRSADLEAGFYWDTCFCNHPVYFFYGMEPASCRFLFPCRDVIDDKTSMTTTVTVSDTLTALAPGMLVEMETFDGCRTFTWQMSRDIPLYSWGLVISDFTVFEDDAYGWIRYYAFDDQTWVLDSVFNNVDLMMDCFQEIYGRYPWDHNLNFPCTPYPLFGEQVTMPYICIPLENYVSHELAHQWWGNLVTEADWNEIWLAEGMATYSEALWDEWMYGSKRYFSSMTATMRDYLNSRENFPIVPAADLWTFTTYNKAASVIHMLRHVTGDDAFFAGLRLFLEANAYGSVTSVDFREAFETASGQDLNWFFDQWLYQVGCPEYSLSCSICQNGQNWEVEAVIQQVQTAGPMFAMPVDLLVTGADEDSLLTIWNDSESDTLNLSLRFQPKRIQLDPFRWILRRDMLSQPKKRKGSP
jgi:aminopeptidase N